jgi:hypothetical protein
MLLTGQIILKSDLDNNSRQAVLEVTARLPGMSGLGTLGSNALATQAIAYPSTSCPQH